MLTYNPYQLNIELNMSNNVLQLENMLSYQANRPFIYGCHNFYPQRNTGLGYEFFIECSRHYKAQGIKTAAFVSSHFGNLGPWNVNDGLPTLEMHRDLPIDVQAKHLFATDLIDVVIIGNAYASEEELVALSQVNRYQIELTVETVPDISPIEEKLLIIRNTYDAETSMNLRSVLLNHASFTKMWLILHMTIKRLLLMGMS